MKIRIWPRNWATPYAAWSLLWLQYGAMQEMRLQPAYVLADDATEEELQEMAGEQRELRLS